MKVFHGIAAWVCVIAAIAVACGWEPYPRAVAAMAFWGASCAYAHYAGWWK